MTVRLVELVVHDPAWQTKFADMRTTMLDACAPWVTEVHHVGSTSIPAIMAKPVIDMMPVVAAAEDGAACVPGMEGLGFEYRGDAGIPGRLFFRKGEPRSHHVHLFPVDHSEVGRLLRFRDYLIAHPEMARAYEALKQELAERFRDDIATYAAAKDPFCLRIEELARRELGMMD